jgi:hypothetical protein
MRVRRSVIAAGAAGILGTTGALAPAVASAHSAAHTLTFTSVARKFVRLSKTTGAQQDTDLSTADKTIGFDDANFAIGKTTSSADIAFVLSGGFMYRTLKVSRRTGAATGPVTGGPAASPGPRNDHRQVSRQERGSHHDHLQQLAHGRPDDRP